MAYSDNQAGVVEERFITRPNYRAIAGTTDTLTTTDVDDILNYSGGTTAVTVPIATTFVAPVGTVITIINSHATLVVTLTRSGSDTINGTTSATVAAGAVKRFMKVAESSGNSTWLLY